MMVIGGILLFAAGMVTGGGAVAYHLSTIEKATAKLRRENTGLKQDIWQSKLDTETDKAYQEGYERGRKHPVHAVEEFSDLLEKHNATISLRKGC